MRRDEATRVTRSAKPGQQVLVALRRLIADGTIKPGMRIGEIATAERLGVSRMPVRTALRALEHEGLVVKLGARGYTPRAVNAETIRGAIEVRGVLEGLAARHVAARHLQDEERVRLAQVLACGNAIFEKGHFVSEDLDRFYRYNLDFHELLLALSSNPSISLALERNNHLPFASAAALALDWDDLDAEYVHLRHAHEEHMAVFDAICAGNAVLAERLMRDHARAAISNGRIFKGLRV
nr:GntR family transcriptional regulator [Novosphingobium olei]